jgi:aspartate racemase
MELKGDGNKLHRLGLIGGMSWESTAHYYQHINQVIQRERGGYSSADLLLHSLDFSVIEQLQHSEQWEEAGKILAESARLLEKAGAELILICTNTMHKIAFAVESAISVPLLHIADPLGEKIREEGFRRAILLGTEFTMNEDFYKKRLEEYHGIEACVPQPDEAHRIDRIIFEELVFGMVKADSKKEAEGIVTSLAQEEDISAVILGCTELSMIFTENLPGIQYYDSAEIHAQRAAEFSIRGF